MSEEYIESLPALRSSRDDIAALPPHRWSHNAHYYRTLLRTLNSSVGGSAVDLFCGEGQFTRALAAHFPDTIGVELSESMLVRAHAETDPGSGVRYICEDPMAYDLPEGSCGCISVIAALHHLPLEDFLIRARRALKRGGRLVVLDLYQPSTPVDLLYSIAASFASKFFSFFMDRRTLSAHERAVWRAHAALDSYMTLSALRKRAEAVLPGVRIQRRLLWRYTLVWTKP